MALDVQSLFRDVADFSEAERERYFDRLQVPSAMRAEVESLCGFDRRRDSWTGRIAEVASELLTQPDFAPAPGAACGPYRLVRLLGKGGMGAVFLAERADGEVTRTVAIKFIRSSFGDPGRRDRFLRERQILASLNHPGIARLFDAGHSAAGQPYLVMEYIEGVPLDEFARHLDLRDKLKLFLQVAGALAYAHRNLVIHRDLKPSNILVDASGQAKLLDFGIAKILDDEAPGVTGERLLTPEFASPEQVRGQPQTTATDVYSLGAVLYLLLTGQPPHSLTEMGAEPIETLICSVDPKAPGRLNPSIPADLDYIAAKALRKEPEARYASMDAFSEDIVAFLERRPVHARSGSTWYRTRKLLRRHWLPASAIAAAMVSLAAGMVIANHERVIAQRRFSQLRQLSVTLLHLDPDLNGLPGATQVRKKVVAASMDYLEGLGREAGEDRQLNLDLAEGYVSLAHVQGVPAYPNLGQFDEADRSLAKAEIFAQRAGAETGNQEALLTAAEVAQDRMMVADTVHRRREAQQEAEKCAARAEKVVRNPSVSKSQISEASRLLANVALAESNMHRYEDAVRYARRELEMARSGDARSDYVVAGTSVLANARRLSGDLAGALQSITEARNLAEQSTFPNEVHKVSVLYAVLNRQGSILGEYDSISLNRPADAVQCFRTAYDLMDQQASRDPSDATCRDRVATVGKKLADILTATDAPQALSIYDHSLQRLREIKGSVHLSRTEADMLARSSYALRRLGRVPEAAARIDAATELLKTAKDYPATAIRLGEEIETTLRARADHLAAIGEAGRALEIYRELLEKVLASNPVPRDDLLQANDLSRIYLAMARLARLTGNPTEAESIDARRMELWRFWDQKLPHNEYVRRELAASSLLPPSF